MSDERDLLGAADALLRRHAAPRAAEDDVVPTLTELIAPGSRPAPPGPAASDAFTREIVAEVVAEVEARLARDLERRLTQHLVAEVQAAVVAALGDLRQDVANAVGDAVAEALSRRPPR
jgi:mono/diheme cytochrome c family protein